MSDQQRTFASRPLWHTHVGIIALLLLIVAALAGGIIWYNARKSNQLAVAAAERMMVEVGNDVSDRIKLLYDPMYAIVGIASLVPELTSPSIKDDPRAMSKIYARCGSIRKSSPSMSGSTTANFLW